MYKLGLKKYNYLIIRLQYSVPCSIIDSVEQTSCWHCLPSFFCTLTFFASKQGYVILADRLVNLLRSHSNYGKMKYKYKHNIFFYKSPLYFVQKHELMRVLTYLCVFNLNALLHRNKGADLETKALHVWFIG